MKDTLYQEIEGKSSGFLLLAGLFGIFIFIALVAFFQMEHQGHHITGMDNQIVWGIPHVFAVFLIVSASGALNVASISSVFGKSAYKPLARLSGLLAIALLAGGLAVLVLDLGRPDRLLVAMTTYNFKSIFAWNIYLYNGFFIIVALYLWMMMERRMNRYSHSIGLIAFIWRLALTTGTGCIFGFLVARQAYDAAIIAPMFVVMSFAFGMAIFLVVLMTIFAGTGRVLGDEILQKMRKLLAIFVAAVLYFVLIYHLTNLYASEHSGVEQFILSGNNLYSTLFWVMQILIGSIVPLVILLLPVFARSRNLLIAACLMIVLGGFTQMYIIIIGGQAYPLELFPGMEVSSSFYDGQVNSYLPSSWEILLGLGGIGIALSLVLWGIKIMPFIPANLSDPNLADSVD